jgi:2-hydroxy-3-oxopropionate reductase
MPMARHVLAAGFELTVYARSDAPLRELADLGAGIASSPAEAGGTSEIVLTMLPASADLVRVMGGISGLLQGLRPSSILVDMGTHEPRSAPRFERLCATVGAGFLDAPVSGGEIGAIEGRLSIMVGGPEATFQRVLPVLQAMATTITHIGGIGAGQIAKACNQLVVGSTIEAVAEALVLAARAGVDPARVREAMQGGYAASRVLDVHGARMLQHQFAPGGRVRLHLKDARIVLSTARSVGVPIPGFKPVARALRRLVLEGRGELDHAALVLPIEDDAGVTVNQAQATFDLD